MAYLLDDRDLYAVAMRSIISSSFGPSASEGGTHDCLPLALVDWHSELAKFDSSLYVTTVLALHDMVEYSISTSPPKSQTDYSEQRAYIERLEIRLGIGTGWDGPRIRARIDSDEAEQLPFMLSDDEITAAARAYASDLGDSSLCRC